MYKTTLQKLIDKRKFAYVIFLNPDECRLRTKSKTPIIFPYNFSKLEVMAVNSEKEIPSLEKKAESLGLKNTGIICSLSHKFGIYTSNMFFGDKLALPAYAA